MPACAGHASVRGFTSHRRYARCARCAVLVRNPLLHPRRRGRKRLAHTALDGLLDVRAHAEDLAADGVAATEGALGVGHPLNPLLRLDCERQGLVMQSGYGAAKARLQRGYGVDTGRSGNGLGLGRASRR